MKNLLAVLLILIVAQVNATDIPSGNVSGVWSLANSPYVIQGNIRVPVGMSLIIEPGVEVLFNGPYSLRVLGNLNAIGAEGDSISFSSNTGLANWKGLKLDSLNAQSDTVRLRFCKISKMSGGSFAIINTHKFILEDSRMYQNTGHVAGCIYTFNSSFQARRNYFHNNSTANQSDGGVLYVRDAAPIIELNIFRNNSATYSGGAISCWRQNGPSTPIIRDNTFLNNSAASGGAIILHDNTVAEISGNQFLQNSVSVDGGAIWVGYVQAGIPQITNNFFDSNTATQKGGALRMVSTKGLIEQNTFNNNTAATGGALYINDGSVVNLDACEFNLNESNLGGAVYLTDDMTCNFSNCFFNNNSANVGGALFMQSYVVSELANCIFVNNNADTGAAIRIVQHSHPIFVHCVFAKNSSLNVAALSLYWNADPLFVNSIFWANPMNIQVQDYITNYCNPSFENCLVEGELASLALGTSTLGTWNNILGGEPNFIGPFGGGGLDYDGNLSDWHVNLNSTCIDAGTEGAYPLPVFDYQGDIRVQGGFPDLGIYEGGILPQSPVITQQPSGVIICPQENDTIEVFFEGAEPVLVEWFNLDNNDQLVGQGETFLLNHGVELPGLYYARLSNFFGVTFSDTVEVNMPASFDISASPSDPFLCEQESVEISFIVSGPDQEYQYSLNDVIFDGTTQNLNEGDYILQVTDSWGCSVNLEFPVVLDQSPIIEIQEIENSSCISCTDGSITFVIQDGTAYDLNGFQIFASPAEGLISGTYILTACNDNGCCTEISIEVNNDNFPIEGDVNGDNVIDVQDLLTLLSNFECTDTPCAGDLNGDGVVNVNDLISLLGFL